MRRACWKKPAADMVAVCYPATVHITAISE
jgi:hypothetical protein